MSARRHARRTAEFYAAAKSRSSAAAWCPIGGHNLLEPAALNRPIIVGPHTFNAADIAQNFLESGAAVRVESATELGTAVLDLLTNAARRDQMIASAHEILQTNRGTLARCSRSSKSFCDVRQAPEQRQYGTKYRWVDSSAGAHCARSFWQTHRKMGTQSLRSERTVRG